MYSVLVAIMKKKLFYIILFAVILYRFIISYGMQHLPYEENDRPCVTENVPEVDWGKVGSGPIGSMPVNEETKTGKKTKKAKLSDESLFNGFYAYSTLSDEGKLLYNEIYTAVLGHKEKVLLTTTDEDMLKPVYYAFTSDNSELFWVVGYSYVLNMQDDKPVSIEFSPTYNMPKENADAYKKMINNSAEIFLSGISMDATDYEKSKYVYEVLAGNVEYGDESPNNQNVISVLIDGVTVCRGYACAAQYLLRRLGIESVIVNGEANDESHAWNLVCLDGEWYHFDVTWGNSKYRMGETINKYIDYGYLNITDEEIAKTHVITDRFILPGCNSVNDNYFIKEGRYASDEDSALTIVHDRWEAGYSGCNMKFANEEIYGSFIKNYLEEGGIRKHTTGFLTYSYVGNQNLNTIIINFGNEGV